MIFKNYLFTPVFYHLHLFLLVVFVCFQPSEMYAQSYINNCDICEFITGEFYGVDSVVQRQKVSLEGCMLKSRNYDEKDSLVWGAQTGLKGMDTSYVGLGAIDANKGNYQAVILFPSLRFEEYGKITEFWTDSTSDDMFCIGTPLNTLADSEGVLKANKALSQLIAHSNTETSIEVLKNRDSTLHGLKLFFEDPTGSRTSMQGITIALDGDLIATDSLAKNYLGRNLQEGDHFIEVSSTWWKGQSRTITIEKGKLLQLIVKFQPQIFDLGNPPIYNTGRNLVDPVTGSEK